MTCAAIYRTRYTAKCMHDPFCPPPLPCPPPVASPAPVSAIVSRARSPPASSRSAPTSPSREWESPPSLPPSLPPKRLVALIMAAAAVDGRGGADEEATAELATGAVVAGPAWTPPSASVVAARTCGQ